MGVTPSQFKAAKPQFQAVPDETVSTFLDLASRMVDARWLPLDQRAGQIAFACHLMTLDGLGTDPESKSFASGTAQFSTIRSGEITLTRFRTGAGNDASYDSWLGATACGKHYAFLLRMNKRGAIGISISNGAGGSAYAKDPCGQSYGWPGVFNA